MGYDNSPLEGDLFGKKVEKVIIIRSLFDYIIHTCIYQLVTFYFILFYFGLIEYRSEDDGDDGCMYTC